MTAFPPPPPTPITLIIDDFILYATKHLSTVGGIINTVSLYPPLQTPGPGVIIWRGYIIQPSTPGGGISTTEVDTTPIELTEAQLQTSNQATLAGSNINEATAAGFEVTFEAPPPPTIEIEQVEYQLLEEAKNEPDPPLSEEDKPKNDVPPQPNYKTNVKVPNELVAAMIKYKICTTNIERAHFLAQCEHESGGFRYKQEIWGPTAAQSGYEGRDDLGNLQKGDGYKFRGRGYIQLTGKDNYTAFGKSINEDIAANPQWVAEKYALLSAAWFFSKNGLHKLADGGATDAVVTQITKRVNGGTIGLPDRIKHFKEYHALLA